MCQRFKVNILTSNNIWPREYTGHALLIPIHNCTTMKVRRQTRYRAKYVFITHINMAATTVIVNEILYFWEDNGARVTNVGNSPGLVFVVSKLLLFFFKLDRTMDMANLNVKLHTEAVRHKWKMRNYQY